MGHESTATRRSALTMLTAVSAGLAFATCCFPLLGQSVSIIGIWVVPVIVLSGILCLGVGVAYAELAGMYPSAAGIRIYISKGLHPVMGIMMSLLYLPLVISLGAAETYMMAEVLERVIPGIPAIPVILSFVAFCAVANIVGLEMSGRLQAYLTYGVLAGLTVFVGAILLDLAPAIPQRVAEVPSLELFLAQIAAVTFLFVGFEWVVATVEDVGNRAEVMPLAIVQSVGLLTVVYAFLGAAMALVVSGPVLASSPIPHVLMGEMWGGPTAMALIAVVSACATITSFNSGILGASRLVYALSREALLPRFLARLHDRFRTPWTAIVFIAGLVALSAVTLATTDAYVVPVIFSATIECVVFSAVLVAVLRLRKLEPNRPRPYRMPVPPLLGWPLALIFLGLAVGCLFSIPRWTPTVSIMLLAAIFGTSIYSYRCYLREEAESKEAEERRKKRHQRSS